jgi:hypothetical protein
LSTSLRHSAAIARSLLQASGSFVCPANFTQYSANLGCRSSPARLFRIGHPKGAIEPGRDADLVVMAHHPRRYDARDPARSRTDPAVRSNFIMLHTFY